MEICSLKYAFILHILSFRTRSPVNIISSVKQVGINCEAQNVFQCSYYRSKQLNTFMLCIIGIYLQRTKLHPFMYYVYVT
jgi:hypothetical protein